MSHWPLTPEEWAASNNIELIIGGITLFIGLMSLILRHPK